MAGWKAGWLIGTFNITSQTRFISITFCRTDNGQPHSFVCNLFIIMSSSSITRPRVCRNCKLEGMCSLLRCNCWLSKLNANPKPVEDAATLTCCVTVSVAGCVQLKTQLHWRVVCRYLLQVACSWRRSYTDVLCRGICCRLLDSCVQLKMQLHWRVVSRYLLQVAGQLRAVEDAATLTCCVSVSVAGCVQLKT